MSKNFRAWSARLICAALLLASAFTVSAMADNYPSRQIRLIVPFSAGGATDALARIIAEHLREKWGQVVVVENRTGAGGNIGASEAAKSAPDGYTLLMGAIGTNAVNAALYKTMPYDTLKDFAPITQVAEFPMLLVVHNSVKANNVKELIALAKAKPGELNAGNGGVGTSQHLATLLFETMTGTSFQGVSYKGFAAALSDMLSGNIQLTFGDMATLLPHLASGKMRPLAVTSKDRSPILPNVPTIAEAGVPGYEAVAWYGLFAPAGTPKEIVDKIQKEVAAYIKTPAVVERFQKMDAEPVGSTPEAFKAHVISEKKRWGEAVAKAGLSASQ